MLIIKREIYLILLVLLTVSFITMPVLGEEAPNIEWQRCFGGSWSESASRIIPTQDEGFLIFGSTSSADGDFLGNTVDQYHSNQVLFKIKGDGTLLWKRFFYNIKDFQESSNGDIICIDDGFHLIKLDEAGKTIWERQYSSDEAASHGNKINLTNDGGYIAIGTNTWDNGICNGVEPQLIKFDSSGNILFKEAIGRSKGTDFNIQQTPEGGYLFVGDTPGVSNYISLCGDSNASIKKYNSNGEVEWARSYGGDGFEDPITPSTLIQKNDGYTFITGTRFSNGQVSGNHGDSDIWFVSTDATGNLLLQVCYGGSGTDTPLALYSLDNGEYDILGITNSYDGDLENVKSDSGKDLWFLRTDSSGAITQQKSYNVSEIGIIDEASAAKNLVRTPDGGFLLLSSSDSGPGIHGSFDYKLTKFSSEYDILWSQCYGGSLTEYGIVIQGTPDGGYILAGQGVSNDGDVGGNHGAGDIWIAKVKEGATIHPLVTSVSPDRSYSFTGDNLDITIYGTGLSSNAIFSLRKPGQPEIQPMQVTCNSQGIFECKFYMKGATPGFWNVHVTNQDGLEYTLNNCYNYIVVEPVVSSWEIEEINESSSISGLNSIKVDKNGNPHIIYQVSDTSSHLKYGWKDDTGWHSQDVPFSDLTNSYGVNDLNFVLDTSANPHISYSNRSSTSELSKIMYFKHTSSGWQSDMIGEGAECSMSLDKNGYPHITFINQSKIMYTFFDGSNWIIEDTGMGSFDDSSIFLYLDSSDYAHIAFVTRACYVNCKGRIQHINKDSTGWHVSDIDNPDSKMVDKAFISFNQDKKLQVLYHTTYPTRPYYSSSDGETWYEYKILDPDYNLINTFDLALNSSNQPNIAFVASHLNSSTNQNDILLMYEYFDGLQWRITQVDDKDISYGQQTTSIALDKNNLPYICYPKYSNGRNKLVLAKMGGGSSLNPTIITLTPNSIPAGSDDFTLNVTGTNFVDGAKVLWDGQERSTEFISSTKLTAVISKADAAIEGNYPISIVNLDGSYSNEFKFRVLSNTEASGQEAIINRAVEWAKSKEGSTSYEDASMTYCLGFVKDAYMGGAEAPMSLKFDRYYQSAPDQCAKTAFNYLNEVGKIHQGIPLKGAWVFYDVNAAGYSNYGHVGIAIDDLGNILNVQRGGVREDNYLFPGSSVFTYIGWAYPPLASPIPVSPSGGASVNPDDVSFSWENLDWANIGEQPDYYELYISEQPYGESNIIFRSSDYGDGEITTTSFEYPDDIPESQKLKAGTLYRWNVRAHYPTYGWDKPAAKSYFTTGDEVGSEIPVADFTISPESLKTYNDIILDGSKSKTVEGSKLIDFIWRIDNGWFLHSYSPQFYTKISTPGFHDISLTVVDDNGRTSQPKNYLVEVKPDPNFKWWVQLSGPEKTSNYETKHYTINITNQVPGKNIGPVVVKLTYSPEYEIIEQSENAKHFYVDNNRPLNQKYSISINNGASKSENEAYSQNAYWIIDKVWYPGSKLITFEIQLKQKISTTPDLFLNVEVKEISQLSTNALYPGIGWTPENVENNKAGKDRLAKATDLDATLIKCLFETNDPTKLPEGFNGLPFDIRGAAHTWFASNGIYTPENYVENSEGDKHYNIVFSHSGGTQVLYQKMKNKKVTADYAFFVAPALISQDQMKDLIDSGAVKKKIFIIQSTQDLLYNAHVLDFQKKYDFSWNPFITDIHSGLNVEVAGTPLDDLFKPSLGVGTELHTKWNYIDVDPLLLTEGIDKEQLPDQSSFWIGGSNRDYQELFYTTYVTPEHDYAINTINVEYTNKHPWLNPCDDIEVHGYLLDWLIEQYNLGKIYPFDGSIPDLIKPSLPGEQHAIKKIDYATAHDPNTKIGPEGHYPSDQPINYRVEYENEGDGSAFGVYITDVLDPSLDDATLDISPVFSIATGQQIAGSGIYYSVNRTIQWDIGEVGPGEGGFANISVKFSPTVPDDTKVTNYATVVFPSAFEETQTNAIVTIKGVNLQPDVPNLTYPYINDIDLPVNGTLFWQCHDPNNETLVYDVYFGNTSSPPLVLENTTLDRYFYSELVNDATYYWKIIAKDPYDGVTSSEIHQFTIISNTLPPIANFTFNATFGQVPLSIQYIDNSTGNITSRFWSFGDDIFAENVTEVTHTYTHSGNYTVNLTVSGPDGEDSASQVIQVLAPQFTLFGNATLYGNPAPSGTEVTASVLGYNTTFSTTIIGQYGESELGKGLVLTGDIPNGTPVTFTIGGLPARCRIVNEDGAAWSDSYPFLVNSSTLLDLDVPATIAADFSGIPTTGYAPLDVLFTDNSTGDPFEREWDFGDGAKSGSNQISINHTFTTLGSYPVSLKTTRVSSSDTETKTDYITVIARPSPPIADFNAAPVLGPAPLRVVFSDNSTGEPDTYLWNFGDGKTSSDKNPVHTYTTKGLYSITLTVENEGGTDSIQKSGYIMVEGPIKALPGLKKLPRDLDGDGTYEDLDGNGKVNMNDLILFARYFQWIQRNEPGSAFDFNHNGKLEFDDFLGLLQYVTKPRR